ncbi:MAG TPA: CaiB/BaiF CoA-transferase family protein, partial [Paraburkholderia sp.]|nr:CaiB/BaiF CoA-transferase family protein [Paraburkholderia sp.]
ELIAQADVLVQNLAPGAAARMGLSFDELHAKLGKLIVCDISGYGADGPYRDKKAYDLLIQSEAAFLSVTGTPDEPSKAGNSIADIAAGMYAYTGILSALLQRNLSGEGSHVEVSMLEALSEWMGFPMYYAYDGQSPPGRNGAAHATIYPYGPFKAGDDRVVMLGLQNEREWKLFCDVVLRRPELAADPCFDANVRRSENRVALKAIIEETFKSLTVHEVIARLDEAQIANAAVNQVGDLWKHPQLHARERFAVIGSPGGDLQALLPPANVDSFDVRMDPVPALGEHSVAILRELGRSEAVIQKLQADGVI